MQFLKTKKFFLVLGSIALLAAFVLPKLIWAQGANFLTGDLLVATNVTQGSGAWSDPVTAAPGNLIEFNMLAQNMTPGTVAHNVKISASLPGSDATTLAVNGTVSADDASSVSDTATVNVTGNMPQGLEFVPGHSRIFSKSCPSGCPAPDTVTSGGVMVGDLAGGESAQVLFKAFVTNKVMATPTPTQPAATGTPTPTPTTIPTGTPTPTTTPVPTGTLTPTPIPTVTTTPQGAVVQCPEGTVQTVSGSTIVCLAVSQNQSQQQTATGGSSSSTSSSSATGGSGGGGGSSTVNVTTTAPAATTPVVVTTSGVTTAQQLPKTGLPTAAWLLSGLLPAGFGVKRWGQGKNEGQGKTARYLWQKRDFMKED